MPDYSPLARSSPQSPQVLSTHTQGSIRRRSGSHKVVIPSQTVSIGSRHPRSDYFHDGAWQSAEDGHSKASTHGTVMASSSTRSASHFTTIPGRAHRTSIIFSRSSPYLQHRERSTLSRHVSSITTSTVDYKESLTLRTPVSANNSDDVVASSGPPSTSPTAGVSSSHLSGFFTSVQSLTKQLSSKTQSGLVTLRRKAISFPKPRLPTFDSTKPPSPKSRFGLDRQLTSYSSQSFLSATDKLTQKWPQPQSLRLVPPGFRADLISSDCGYLRGLRGVGVWSQRNLEAALRDSQGLGIEWIGQWTLHKWCLLGSVTTVFLLGLTCLIYSILTWFTAYPTAPVLLITDSPALILLTISSSLLLLSSLVGITGTLLNSRPILAVYVLLLFPSFISFVSVGYVTYKKANFSLDEKVSQAWNLWYSPGARMVLQGALSCCGWSGPLHGATPSGTCYARSPLPGCHGPLMRFERETLSSAAWTVFSLVPLHLANIFVGLLCANHVTHRFGKGITPARYRLSVQDVLSSVSAASATSGSGNNPPHKKTQAQVHLPVPPLLAPTSHHGAFREDRQTRTTYRHARIERLEGDI